MGRGWYAGGMAARMLDGCQLTATFGAVALDDPFGHRANLLDAINHRSPGVRLKRVPARHQIGIQSEAIGARAGRHSTPWAPPSACFRYDVYVSFCGTPPYKGKRKDVL